MSVFYIALTVIKNQSMAQHTRSAAVSCGRSSRPKRTTKRPFAPAPSLEFFDQTAKIGLAVCGRSVDREWPENKKANRERLASLKYLVGRAGFEPAT
ncbi:MAG: hypothetical protein RSH52_20810, partial [Janthinobacterium sp.]